MDTGRVRTSDADRIAPDQPWRGPSSPDNSSSQIGYLWLTSVEARAASSLDPNVAQGALPRTRNARGLR